MRHTATLPTLAAAALATLSALALAACGQPADSTTGTDPGTTSAQRVAADLKAAASAAADKVKQIAGADGDAVAGAAQDVEITAKVNAELAKDQQLVAAHIDVQTKDGRVKLSGRAPDASARDRAAAIASQVDGVVAVENRLSVVNGA